MDPAGIRTRDLSIVRRTGCQLCHRGSVLTDSFIKWEKVCADFMLPKNLFKQLRALLFSQELVIPPGLPGTTGVTWGNNLYCLEIPTAVIVFGWRYCRRNFGLETWLNGQRHWNQKDTVKTRQIWTRARWRENPYKDRMHIKTNITGLQQEGSIWRTARHQTYEQQSSTRQHKWYSKKECPQHVKKDRGVDAAHGSCPQRPIIEIVICEIYVCNVDWNIDHRRWS